MDAQRPDGYTGRRRHQNKTMADTIILHQWEASPFCNKVRKMLAHKGLSYEVKNYHGLLSLKAAGVGIGGFLPVLEVGGEKISDSTEIAHYLDRTYPIAPLYPADARLRVSAELWEDWADEAFHWFEVYLRMEYPEVVPKVGELLSAGRPRWEQALLQRVVPRMYRKRMKGQGIGRLPREEVRTRFFRHMDMLETTLAIQRWLVGDGRTIADIAVAGQLDEIVRTTNESKVHEYRATLDWLKRVG